MDQEALQREIDLLRIVTTLLETLRPLLDASTRQFIRQATSLADLVVLASGDAVVPFRSNYWIARMCVALAQSDRSSTTRGQIMKEVNAKYVNLRAQLTNIQVNPDN